VFTRVIEQTSSPAPSVPWMYAVPAAPMPVNRSGAP
jgi:hypothetical protein